MAIAAPGYRGPTPMVRAVDKADAMLTLSSALNIDIGSDLAFGKAHGLHQLNTNKFACFMIDSIKTLIKLHFQLIK